MSDRNKNDAAILARVFMLAKQGKSNEAIAQLDDRVFDSPLEIVALMLKARILEELDVEKCWNSYQSALRKYPDHPFLNLRAGIFTYRRGDLVRAKELLTRCWQKATTPEAGYYLGKIYSHQAESNLAMEYFIQTVALEGEEGYWRESAIADLVAIL